LTTVRLDWHEVFHAASCGVLREIQARKNGKRTRFESRDSWGTNIEGACAELAVSRLIGCYWHAIVADPNGLPGDAGPLQIRSTPHDDGHLVVYDTDPDQAIFVLVIGTVPVFVVRGWMQGSMAKRSQWWRPEGKAPAYWIPQSELRPMSQIKHFPGLGVA